MGFRLIDLADSGRVIRINAWNWRPTVEIIRRADLLDFIDLCLLDVNGSEVQVSKDEAKRIAQHLRTHILPHLSVESRVELDGSSTEEPDTGEFYRKAEDMHKNYGATREWLERFADFCETSGGFEVR